VGAVTPQPQDGRAQAPPPAVPPEPRQRQQDEAQALASSLSDELDVSTLLDTDAALSYRRAGIGPDVLVRLRRGQWSIQAQLDLHGLRRDEARDALAAFIRQAERDGLRCVRVVHGKGNGSPGREPVLKDKVKRWPAPRPAPPMAGMGHCWFCCAAEGSRRHEFGATSLSASPR
jgi:DNA-nicking Smr family endonuclease